MVDRSAELDDEVVVEAFAVVERGATIGRACLVESHAVVRGGTQLGAYCRLHSFAVLGGPPQDRRYEGEPTRLEIGESNVFREHVTVHRGTAHGGAVTRIGHGGLFMSGSHVAHDCLVGDGVTLANATLLGGHVVLGDQVTTGGHVAIAPYVRVGALAFLAGGAMVERDVPPFVIAAGDRARVRTLNTVGLDRGGVAADSRAALEKAFRQIFRSGTPRRVAAARFLDHPDGRVRYMAQFVAREPKSRASQS